jgi:hypothetical protein
MARLQQKMQAAEPQVWPDIPTLPARWLYGLYVISPGTGFIAPVAAMLVKGTAA